MNNMKTNIEAAAKKETTLGGIRQLKNVRRILSVTLFFCLIAGSAIGASADAGTDIVASITELTDVIFLVIRAIGLILAGFGIFNVGSSFTSHDASQRSQGFMLVGGGLMIFFVKELLAQIGVSI